MTDDLDLRLAARFALQDDAALHPIPGFAPVRARAAGIELRRKRRRRLILVAAAVLAALIAVPAIAVSHSLVERVFGKPAAPGLRDYIGRVLHVRPGSAFATPPRYVAAVQTTRGLVLLWAGRRSDGTQCTGVEAAFGDTDVVRMKIAGRTIADNGFGCGGGAEPLGPSNAGLTGGQGLGSVLVEYGQPPAREHAVRVRFEDGHTQTATAEHGWLMIAIEGDFRRPGHRPILEQALDARGRPIASVRLDPWDYGGTEPPLPALAGPGSTLLETVTTPSGPARLRISASGLGWQRQQCWGIVLGHRATPVECDYPAAFDPRVPPPTTNDLYLFGPSFPGLVIAITRQVTGAWLVSADRSVRRGRIVRLPDVRGWQVVIVAPTVHGGQALAGIVTSRDHRITGALLMADRRGTFPGGATAPCFLAAPSAGAPPTTPACTALMATARPAVTR